MVELDFSNIYNSTGKIVQLRYAEKAVGRGSTIIGMRSNRGAAILVAKPIASKLYVHENNHRITKLTDNAYVAYTGLLPSGLFISNLLKHRALEQRALYRSDPSARFIRDALGSYLYLFTQYNSVRIVGASFLAAVKDGGSYRIIGADSSGKTTEYYGYAYGTGERRALTELENLHLESSDMETGELVDQGIKILYKCHDPLSDTPFQVEAAIISEDTDGKFLRVDQGTVNSIASKYQNLSIDGDNE